MPEDDDTFFEDGIGNIAQHVSWALWYVDHRRPSASIDEILRYGLKPILEEGDE